MKTIETDIQISEDNTLHITIPKAQKLQPGIYHVVMVIDDKNTRTEREKSYEPLKLHVFEWNGWPAQGRFRREDIYESDER